MATEPTTITINYSTASSATVSITTGMNYSDMVANIVKGGGKWLTVAGVLTFIPLNQIRSITAQ